MFDHKHYVPIVKAKAGELWALGNLSAQAQKMITPLVEITPGSKKVGVQKHVETVCAEFRNIWNPKDLIFVDTFYLRSDAPKALERFFKIARTHSLQAVPATAVGRAPDYQKTLKAIVETDQRGFMVRLSPRDFRNVAILKNALDALLDLTGMLRNKVDLLLDYGARPDGTEVIHFLQSHIAQIPDLPEWRTLSAASGSFPLSLRNWPEGKWHSLPREEWEAWLAAVGGNPRLKRLPTYSDFGIRDPGVPPGRGSPSANLRYTTGKIYLVRRGGQVIRAHGAKEMPGICQSLVERSEFCGADFSTGDREIADLAANSSSSGKSSGNPQQWTQWCMNHHFEVVVQQLQSEVGS